LRHRNGSGGEVRHCGDPDFPGDSRQVMGVTTSVETVAEGLGCGGENVSKVGMSVTSRVVSGLEIAPVGIPEGGNASGKRQNAESI